MKLITLLKNKFTEIYCMPLHKKILNTILQLKSAVT